MGQATRTLTTSCLQMRMTLTAGSTRACGIIQARSPASSQSCAPAHSLLHLLHPPPLPLPPLRRLPPPHSSEQHYRRPRLRGKEVCAVRLRGHTLTPADKAVAAPAAQFRSRPRFLLVQTTILLTPHLRPPAACQV